jgi:predicted nucleotidyltransferase
VQNLEEEIKKVLDRIENEQHVRILYAVESGSRAWGFASADSDWDVRFIYLRRPEWYLSIQNRRDVLEYPLADGLDVSGWDLPKTLGLFAKSNPPLLEWLRSPIVYRETFSTIRRLRELSTRYFSPRSCMYHYLHMGEGNFREYLQGEEVRVKKYFYVLRPLLSCRWIESHGTMPPMEFERLVEDQLPQNLYPTISTLLDRKRSGEELDQGPRIPEINLFLTGEIARLRELLATMPAAGTPDLDLLDEVFRASLAEVWRESGLIDS